MATLSVRRWITQEEYDHLHKNFRIAAERAESRRVQMLEQEKQVALLRHRISLLEGSDDSFIQALSSTTSNKGSLSVDDYSIGRQSGALERAVNRWAADKIGQLVGEGAQRGLDVVQSFRPLGEGLYEDLEGWSEIPFLVHLRDQLGWNHQSLKVVLQGLLRHAVGEMITEGIVNELVVTSSSEANRELTKIHENLFVREPLVAAVWRRQTFSAAVDSIDPSLALTILTEHLPSTFPIISPHPSQLDPSLSQLLTSAYTFSRMLHASGRTGAAAAEGSSFFKAFVPEVGSVLEPGPIELVKRCARAERGEMERVGCCVFPGLVKVQAIDVDGAEGEQGGITAVNLAAAGAQKKKKRIPRQLVVKRALVFCSCAMELSGLTGVPAGHSVGAPPQTPTPPLMQSPPPHMHPSQSPPPQMQMQMQMHQHQGVSPPPPMHPSQSPPLPMHSMPPQLPPVNGGGPLATMGQLAAGLPPAQDGMGIHNGMMGGAGAPGMEGYAMPPPFSQG
ncbi:hypothetical protein BT69DRAFT_1298721 [Atractiella rhizophila]|nr:hypothetical protein BT69DRAFT_1298721 [Atractiella rhizophila]